MSVPDILATITAHKKIEVHQRKATQPLKLLEKSESFSAPTASLKEYFEKQGGAGIIAEIKRRSPSKGNIYNSLSVEDISIAYMRNGASALSVLTDSKFFGGSFRDLSVARQFNLCPILCKDFIVDDYQIIEARSYGADVILLIAAVLEKEEIESLTAIAQSLGMEVILEVHSREELERKYILSVDHVGVNNRDLKTFKVDINTSLEIAALLPERVSKIAESGISSPDVIRQLRKAGYNGFLIGEHFLTSPDPGHACRKCVEAVAEL